MTDKPRTREDRHARKPSPAPGQLPAGSRVTRYPLGSGEELHATVLAPDDQRVWAGTPFENLSPQERSEHSQIMRDTFGEIPVHFEKGCGMKWEKIELLYRLK